MSSYYEVVKRVNRGRSSKKKEKESSTDSRSFILNNYDGSSLREEKSIEGDR